MTAAAAFWGALSLVLGLSAFVNAQVPQDLHPFLSECQEYGCFLNWFCAETLDVCIQCPNAFMGTTMDHCRSIFAVADLAANVSTTIAQGANFSQTAGAEPYSIGGITYYANRTAMQLDLDACIAACVKPQAGEPCTENEGCDEGRSFCDYQEQSAEDNATEAVLAGTCRACKEEIQDCLEDPSISSPFGVEKCVLCDVGVCVPLHFSVTKEINEGSEDTIVASNALRGSPMMTARGPLVDCSNLVLREEWTCQNGGNNLPTKDTEQNGKVCLINDNTKSSYFVSVVDRCAALGGVAVVFFQPNVDGNTPTNSTWFGSLSYLPTTIPSVAISYDDGIRWVRERLGEVVEVNVTDVGDACIKKQFCNDEIPCVGSNEGLYCDYKWGGGSGGNGFCRTCPEDDDGNPDPLQCFFSTNKNDFGKAMGRSGVASCASICAADLAFPSCKFCPDDIGGFDFELEPGSSDEKCRFCPLNDVQYPDRDFPLFGDGVKCWQVQKFFESVHVDSGARNCELARAMNYVCGCAGSGYAGASTTAKRVALAWLPRLMAIFSVCGSTFIVYDTVSGEQRERLMSQLLAGLSLFDVIGSAAYAFTTLPIPEDWEYGPIYGAKGNGTSCSAQGFLIQMGTISAYMNVSLAFYYYLVIARGWEEYHFRRVKWVLFAAPVALGFAFAFAGIKHYGCLLLWCNNTASYWPDIPVAVAIGVATVLMTMICWDVYINERASLKWRGADAELRLSQRVIWQSIFYLLSFYLTWPAYLGLQYAWARGNSFTNYGLILTAATLVPLQGFWNMLVYIRPRYATSAMQALRRSVARTSQSGWLGGSSRSVRRGPRGSHRPASKQSSGRLESSTALPAAIEEEKTEH